MPALDRNTAEKVENAEDGFKPLDPGVYVVALLPGDGGKGDDIDVREGDKGIYWSWTFEIPELDAEGEPMAHAGRRFWLNTSLSEAAFFRLKEVFAAFGVPTNFNTKELLGRRVRLQLNQSVQQSGKNAGKLVNQIEHVLPLDGLVGPDDIAGQPVADAKPAVVKKNDEPLF